MEILFIFFDGTNAFAGIIYSAKKTVVRLMSAEKLALNRMQKLCSIMHIYYSNWPSQNKESICLCTPRPFFFLLLLFLLLRFPSCLSAMLVRQTDYQTYTHFRVVGCVFRSRICYTNSAVLIGPVWVESARACVMTIILWFFFFVRDVLKYFSCFTRISLFYSFFIRSFHIALSLSLARSLSGGTLWLYRIARTADNKLGFVSKFPIYCVAFFFFVFAFRFSVFSGRRWCARF